MLDIFNIFHYINLFFHNKIYFFYILLFLVIFLETGVIFLSFLPGDSLLLSIGILASSTSDINIILILCLLTLAAILGDFVSYISGFYLGDKLLYYISNNKRYNSFFLKTDFFLKNNPVKTMIFSRFIPICRTICPFLAGVTKMRLKIFIFYNIAGAFLWIFTITLFGYFLGTMPLFTRYRFIFIYIIILIFSIPILYTFIVKLYNFIKKRF